MCGRMAWHWRWIPGSIYNECGKRHDRILPYKWLSLGRETLSESLTICGVIYSWPEDNSVPHRKSVMGSFGFPFIVSTIDKTVCDTMAPTWRDVNALSLHYITWKVIAFNQLWSNKYFFSHTVYKLSVCDCPAIWTMRSTHWYGGDCILQLCNCGSSDNSRGTDHAICDPCRIITTRQLDALTVALPLQ